MARVKRAMMTRKRRNKVLKLAKGYWGSKSRHFKMAKQQVMKSGNYAYVGRKAGASLQPLGYWRDWHRLQALPRSFWAQSRGSLRTSHTDRRY